MRADRASRTSELVALMRALGDSGLSRVEAFRDPTARRLLPPLARTLHGGITLLARLGLRERLRARLGPSLDILPLRTVAIDAAVNEALASGIEQLVILGAGLDGRAHRMPALSAVDVFEVDHPATQRDKRARAEGMPPLARSLRYVAVDFERDALGERLAAAGHDEMRPTVWIWEGVIVYLTDAALRSTLDVIGARSAPGSRLLAQYREPVAEEDRDQRRMVASTRWVGEPHIGHRTRATMAREVERVGLRVLGDEGIRDWAERYGAGEMKPFTWATRLIVAVAR